MSLWSYQAAPELSDEQYARWQSLLEERAGICFLKHKSILQKGLSQRMREIGVNDYEQYFEQVSRVPEGAIEWAQLVDRVSVKETSFFRDLYSYDAVRDYLLSLLAEKNKEKAYSLDIWSVGCSTGEEAYSLAITANEVIDHLNANVFLGVTATDISQTALAVAKQGRYTSRKIECMPLALQTKYFSDGENTVKEVRQSIRQRMCFAQGNIIELAKVPLMAIDIVFCQNVLVYFRRQRQHELLDNLVEHLKPKGMLIVGPGEVMTWRNPKVRRAVIDNVQAYIKN